MTISKCDVCKKELKERNVVVYAGVGWNRFELCPLCGKSVRGFLEEHTLIEKVKKNTKKK